MFRRPPFILLIAALALGAFFVAMWLWQPRMFPHHLAHSAHKTLRGALEMRGLSALEDDEDDDESARCGALGNAPDGKCGKLNAPLDGSNEKNAASLFEYDEYDRSKAARKLSQKLRKEKFSQLRWLAARVASREASAKRLEFIGADRLDDPVLVGGGPACFLSIVRPLRIRGCLGVAWRWNTRAMAK